MGKRERRPRSQDIARTATPWAGEWPARACRSCRRFALRVAGKMPALPGHRSHGHALGGGVAGSGMSLLSTLRGPSARCGKDARAPRTSLPRPCLGRGSGRLGHVAPVDASRAFGPLRARCPRSQDIAPKAVPRAGEWVAQVCRSCRRLAGLRPVAGKMPALPGHHSQGRASGGGVGGSGVSLLCGVDRTRCACVPAPAAGMSLRPLGSGHSARRGRKPRRLRLSALLEPSPDTLADVPEYLTGVIENFTCTFIDRHHRLAISLHGLPGIPVITLDFPVVTLDDFVDSPRCKGLSRHVRHRWRCSPVVLPVSGGRLLRGDMAAAVEHDQAEDQPTRYAPFAVRVSWVSRRFARTFDPAARLAPAHMPSRVAERPSASHVPEPRRSSPRLPVRVSLGSSTVASADHSSHTSRPVQSIRSRDLARFGSATETGSARPSR